MGCSDCSLCAYSDPSGIPGSGNTKSNIMIINSYASELDEDMGKATMPSHLKEFIQKLGIDITSVYYTNAIKCRVPYGTKYKVSEIKKCKAHLDKEIKKVNPRYILLIGAQALKATCGGNMNTHNGVVIEYDGISYMPMYSPGIISRDPGKAAYITAALNNFKSLIAGVKPELPELDIRIIKNKGGIDRAIEYLIKNDYMEISFDIESTGLDRFEERITLFGFGNNKVQFIIPLEVKFSPLKGQKMAQLYLVSYLLKMLKKHDFYCVAGNGKFDNLFLMEQYNKKVRLDFDVVLASHCLNENTPNGVKENAIVECNALDWDIRLELKKGNVNTKQDYNDYLTYLGYDIYYEYELFTVFREKIKQDKSLYNLFYHLYMPAARAYEEVEEHGVYINPKQFRKARRHLENKLLDIEKQLSKYGKSINWSSPKQVGDLLYKTLKLPVIETTDSGAPSTGESTLLRLRDKHPVVELILKHRGVKIQISHFIDGWINRMNNSRLYPNFKIYGTVTGRTSCTDPNLQQVPRDPQIRNLISAPPGYSIVEADFSQAELRIATILSGDNLMKQIYQTGGDIHTNTYELVSHEKISDDPKIRKEQRKKAKAVNFGFVYGMGWRKFKDYARDSYDVHLTDKEAEQYRVNFFKAYNKLPEWHIRQRKIVKAMGQVRSPIGRIRRLPDIYSSDKGKRAEAERQSINSPVQGFGSDLTILGMVEVMQYSRVYHKHLKLDKSKFFCIGTVHDATLFEVRNDYLIEFLPKVKQIMENPKALTQIFKFNSPVPMIVDETVGTSWGGGIELGENWKKQVQEYLDLQS